MCLPPLSPAAVYTCLQEDVLCNRDVETARKYCKVRVWGCAATVIVVRGAIVHPRAALER